MREVKDTLARPRAGGMSETGAEIRRVTAAWIGPDLTDEAYWTTYGAVTGPRKELR